MRMADNGLDDSEENQGGDDSGETSGTNEANNGQKNKKNSSQGESPESTKEKQLNDLLKGAIKQFDHEDLRLMMQAIFWGILCLVMICFGYGLITEELNHAPNFKKAETSEVYYHVIIRITLFVGLISFTAFLFKMLRTTFHLFQVNRHRLNILRSMPAFIAAAKPNQENKVFFKILESTIKYSNTGLISKESDFNSGFSLIEKIVSSKK